MGLIYLAAYKGRGTLFNGLIRLWNRSQYSHCELLMPAGDWLSSSAMDGGVRSKRIQLNAEHWDLIPVPWADSLLVWQVFAQHQNKGYDWFGLFGAQLLNAGAHSKKRMFCSEFCAAALNLPQPQRYSPALLVETVQRINTTITGQQDEKHA